MRNATGWPRDAASVLFDLPGYRVLDAVDAAGGGREVVAVAVVGEAPCPTCGVLSSRVHQRVRARVADVPVAVHLETVLVKRRFACGESACPRRTFTEVSDQLPTRTRCWCGGSGSMSTATDRCGSSAMRPEAGIATSRG